jgi:hypothetical protein
MTSDLPTNDKSGHRGPDDSARSVPVGRRRRPSPYLLGCLLLPLICSAAFWYGWPFMLPITGEGLTSAEQVALADLNGNGHLDAYIAINHWPRPDHILVNNGQGRFSLDKRRWGNWPSLSVGLADLTGNGIADVLIETGGGGIVYFANDGQQLRTFGAPPGGFLADPGPKGVMRLRPAFGDLNGNGLLDIFAAGCCGREANSSVPPLDAHALSYSQVWLNQGDGRFTTSGQLIGQLGSNEAALADLNGNGHLDVFLANGRTMDTAANYQTDTPNTVWFNDGEGQFADSGQQLGQAESMAVALGDLNGNGFVDAVVGNRGPDEIWFNDEQGDYSDSGQRLGDDLTRSVFLADFNGNGHLDLFVAGQRDGQVWFNDGTGQFQASSQQIRYGYGNVATIGDLNGNGRTDVLVVSAGRYRVWTNDGNGRFRAGFYSRYRLWSW